MIINFDEYKDGEPITIIENGINKTYVHPKIVLSYKLSYNPCCPLANTINLEIVGEDIVYENLKEKINVARL